MAPVASDARGDAAAGGGYSGGALEIRFGKRPDELHAANPAAAGPAAGRFLWP